MGKRMPWIEATIIQVVAKGSHLTGPKQGLKKCVQFSFHSTEKKRIFILANVFDI
jgi:hypothetical protein